MVRGDQGKRLEEQDRPGNSRVTRFTPRRDRGQVERPLDGEQGNASREMGHIADERAVGRQRQPAGFGRRLARLGISGAVHGTGNNGNGELCQLQAGFDKMRNHNRHRHELNKLVAGDIPKEYRR
jgi:hypothetical protein